MIASNPIVEKPVEPVDKVLPLLKKLSQVMPEVWKAECPVSAGSSALDVAASSRGSLTLECCGGCPKKAILNKLALKPEDLEPPEAEPGDDDDGVWAAGSDAGADDRGSLPVAGDDFDAGDEAVDFLRAKWRFHPASPDYTKVTLRRWRGSWWSWDGRKYVPLPDKEITSRTVLHLDGKYRRINRPHVTNMMMHLSARTEVSGDAPMPCWLESRGPDEPLAAGEPRQYITCENGLVDIEAAVKEHHTALHRHDPRWFSPVALPYRFDPAAKCPNWERVVSENLGEDDELVAILQEFFGYCLTADTSFHKFLVLYGEGGTGKSTILGALRAVLGEPNVSAVSLRQLTGRFGPFETLGKLANISAEIGKVGVTDEGILKGLVSGDKFSFEQKNRDAVSAIPTAKLIFATNELPRFDDRSDGIWRRAMVIPFPRKASDAKVIPGMDSPGYWLKNGELPGMLNWAIEGLRRLRANKKFTKAAAADALNQEHRKDCNPAMAFLEDYVRIAPGGEVFKSLLFKSYQSYCVETGNKPMRDSDFAKEVKSVYRGIEDGRQGNGNRSRFWRGIELIDDGRDGNSESVEGADYFNGGH